MLCPEELTQRSVSKRWRSWTSTQNGKREGGVEKTIDKPVIPVAVDAEIRRRTGQWSWITTIFGSGGASLAALAGMHWQTVTAIGALALGGLLIALLLRRQITSAICDIRNITEG